MPATRELAQRHAAFHLEADVDDGQVLLDADDLALDDAAFEQVLLGEAFGEQRGELVARGAKVLGRGSGGLSHVGRHSLMRCSIAMRRPL